MIRRHLWIHPSALFLSGYYYGQASLIESANQYPEFCIQSKKFVEEHVPVISLLRVKTLTFYPGKTDWDDAANQLIGRLANERRNQ